MWVLYLPTYIQYREQRQHTVLFVWSLKDRVMQNSGHLINAE